MRVETPHCAVRISVITDQGTELNGTGFLVSPTGHVATCQHVVRDAVQIWVHLPSQYGQNGPVVYDIRAAPPQVDVALLESRVPLERATIPWAVLHEDWRMDTGKQDAVTVWGCSAAENYIAPQCFPCTISGFSGQHGHIGLNGDINPGDSGAPVVDAAGRVIGIVDLKDARRDGQAMAIPISLLRALMKTHGIVSNPYRGLNAFKEEDADWFFGREELTDQLYHDFRRLYLSSRIGRRLRLLPILGPSGSGKSSVARAGLLARLKREPPSERCTLRSIVLRPGSAPLDSLAAPFAQIVTNDRADTRKTREFVERLRKPTEQGEFDGLQSIAGYLPDSEDSLLVLLIDQFEEIFTLRRENRRSERDIFINNLLFAAGDPSERISVILTLRTDFYGETNRHPDLSQAIAEKPVLVPAMSEKQLRCAIEKPALRVGHKLDGVLVQLLLSETRGREGALPLLQFALTRIWDKIAQGVPTDRAFQDIGGVGGALAGRAQELYKSLDPKDQPIAQRAFLGLIHLGDGMPDTRRRVDLRDMVSHGETRERVHAVLQEFSRSHERIITLDSALDSDGNHIQTAEITHEALLDQWDTLKEWLALARNDLRLHRDLETAAKHWKDRNHHHNLLWRTPDLDHLRTFVERAGDRMTELQKQFFDESERQEQQQKEQAQQQKEQEQRYSRNLRWLARVSSLLAVAAIISALVAGHNAREKDASAKVARQSAERERQSAERAEKEREQAQALAYMGALNKAQQALQAGNLKRAQALLREQIPKSGEEDRRGFEWRYLWQLCQSDERPTFQEGHGDWVRCVAFSPDGQTIATGSLDGAIKLWDAKKKEKIAEPQLPRLPAENPKGVHALAFSPDGRTLASDGEDGTVNLWDVTDPKKPKAFPLPLNAHDQAVNCVAFSPQGRLATGSDDGTVRLWDLADLSKKKAEFGGKPGHEEAVICVAFSHDGKTVASGSNDETVKLWDTDRPSKPTMSLSHTGWVRSVAFAPRGNVLAVGTWGTEVVLWDTKIRDTKNLPIATLSIHRGPVNSVSFSHTGNVLASASQDGTIKLWDVPALCNPQKGPESALLNTLMGHDGRVWSVAFSPKDEMTLISGGNDKTVKLWAVSRRPERDAQTLALQPKAEIGDDKGAIWSVAFSYDSKYLATGSRGWDKSVQLWNVEKNEAVKRAQLHAETKAGEESTSKNNIPERVRGVAFHPKNYLLAAGTGSIVHTKPGQVLLWDVNFPRRRSHVLGAAHKAPAGSKLHEYGVSCVAFSPDGTWLASGSWDNTVKVWDVNTERELAKLPQGEGKVWCLAFSGNWLAVGSQMPQNKGQIQIWNVADIARPKRWTTYDKEHDEVVRGIAFSPDGKWLASSSWDKTVILWEVIQSPVEFALRRRATLRGHNANVLSVAFSPDSKTLATGSLDKTIKLWNLDVVEKTASAERAQTETTMEVTLTGHQLGLFSVAFSPDGRWLASGSWDGTVKLWHAAERNEPSARDSSTVFPR